MSREADDIPDLYERHAAAFIRARGNHGHEARWLARFAALLPAAGHVLDLGCGFGHPVASSLLAQGFDVTGVDTSPSLVFALRARNGRKQ